MDAVEIEENLFVAGDAKLHGGMCKILSIVVCKVLEIFPFIEGARPRSKSGIQALCSLHVALDKAKNLIQHCCDCSKLYLAITGESILVKFEKTRCALQKSLRRVEDIVPEAIGCQIMEIVNELEAIVFELDQSEKQVSDEVISLLQKDRKNSSSSNLGGELEIFHQVASRLGITSSRAALSERRALKKLIERARAEEDRRKESIVSYLLHLMRKYSKHFRNEVADDTDSQGSSPCSPTVFGYFDDAPWPSGHGHASERHISKLSSFSFKQNGLKSGNALTPPEEFRCPISLQLMYDPVIISSGQTYERVCIEKWFNDGHCTCPKTQQQLAHLCLTPNYCVKGLIATWCEQNGVPIPDGPPESLDVNYWRMALSECGATDSRSLGSVDSCMMKGVKVVPLEESVVVQELKQNDNSSEDSEVAELERLQRLMVMLCESKSMRKQSEAVEQIRYLLKDDEEARIYMGSNGVAEALVQFLRSAITEGDEKGQDVGAMALFNLAVNNDRNKELILTAGVMDLLEHMISNSVTQESATALYLNLSCFDEAKPIIGSSQAVHFLVQLLHSDDSESSSCKHDALYTIYNLSTHPSNIQSLLDSDIIGSLQPLLTTSFSGDESLAWPERVLAIFSKLASSKAGKKEIISTPGLIGGLAAILDTGEPVEQEQVVACLLMLCNGDEKCSHMVLQEGVIPALVSVSINGSARGREKAQKLLKLFRELRQRESSPVQENSGGSGGVVVVVADTKPLCKSRSKRLGRTLSSMWKNKSFSVYQC